MGAAPHHREPESRTRIKKEMLLGVLREQPMTCVELAEQFKTKITTIRKHMTTLRDDGSAVIMEWREPEKTGMWSPVYAVRRRSDEQDAPHPPPRNRWRKVEEVAEAEDEDLVPKIVRADGVKKEHALMARARVDAAGVWGGLLPTRRGAT